MLRFTVPFALLLLHSPSPTSTDWTSECVSRYPASCRCTWSSGKRLADCQKANMNGLPLLSSDIQILEFSHNKITSLQDNAFTKANLINVQKLYLKGCRITKIHDLAFNNLRILIEVDLSHNEIEYVDPSVFSTNVRLRVVKLNNNKIHSIREFPQLEYLSSLDLSHNLLTNVSYHTFQGLRNLKVLDLSYNQFSNVNPDIFPRLSSLALRGNAWVCDCELRRLREYVIKNKFFEPELRCSEPLSLYNSQWDGFEELSCKPEILHILANGKIVDSIVALENTLVLSCVVRGEPLPDVKWVKNGRVVQDARVTTIESESIVMVNLTVGRNDNEFVCVGSNSGGVVERNLTVTVDEAGLQGFVVLKDGVERDSAVGFRGATGGLVIYLVIGVVLLSLGLGLILGGVCVWKWKVTRDSGVEGDTVVKGVIKDESGKVPDERGDMVVMTSGRGGGSVQGFAEQAPLLKPHTSADDLLDTDRYVNGRPTPDLLINGSVLDDNESLYTPKFPADNSSVYDNYELVYNKPLLSGADSLRRYAFLRSNDGSKCYSNTVGRPSSVCSEPRGVAKPYARESPVGGDTVIRAGYVTLPRRSLRERKGSAGGTIVPTVIKYDNLGPRSTADGCSNFSLNQLPDSTPADAQYSNLQQLQEDLYSQLGARQFAPIPEDPVREEREIPQPPQQLPPNTSLPQPTDPPPPLHPTPVKKKEKPVPPPKPRKKPVPEPDKQSVISDDGTEV